MPPPMPYQSYPAAASAGPSGTAVAALVLSVLGLVLGGCTSPIGLILGIMAMRQQKDGLALAAVIIGAVGTVFLCIGFGFVVLYFGAIAAVLGFAAAGGAFDQPVRDVNRAVETYYLDYGVYPETLDQLAGLDEDTADAVGSLEAMRYYLHSAAEGEKPEVWFVGWDGVRGTADDSPATDEFDFGGGVTTVGFGGYGTTESDVERVVPALDAYLEAGNALPETTESLEPDFTSDGTDGWFTPFRVVEVEVGYELWSAGPDGLHDTGDDFRAHPMSPEFQRGLAAE